MPSGRSSRARGCVSSASTRTSRAARGCGSAPYLSGHGGHGLWAGQDWESFTARWHEWSRQGLRLVDTAGSKHPCTANALNQVVMPTGTYNYGVTGHADAYHWPVQDTSGATRFARLSHLDAVEPFLTLPFTDPDVKRSGIWRYGNGGWHHAGDYSQGDATFEVKASAAGKVVHVGWDQWSGNTVIISHDVNGRSDAYRTIYMHLRDGADHDADAAWNETMTAAWITASDLADVQDPSARHREHQGSRHPQPRRRALGHERADDPRLGGSAGHAWAADRLGGQHGSRREEGKRRAEHPPAYLLDAPRYRRAVLLLRPVRGLLDARQLLRGSHRCDERAVRALPGGMEGRQAAVPVVLASTNRGGCIHRPIMR